MIQKRFYNNKICLNVLAADVENAKEIYEITEGHVVIGLLAANYATVEQAVNEMAKFKKAIDGAISIGLGAGDPNQWQKVAHIGHQLEAEHINQIFPAVGYTRAMVKNNSTFINCLVNPTEQSGYVNIATGPLSSREAPAKVHLTTAIALIREMGGNSVKLFPLNEMTNKEMYKEITKICANENFAIEPTGGIDLNNFEEIVMIALESGIKQIIPHVYSAIIDSSTGKTNIDDVKQLYEIIKRVGR
ncbi:KDGP aldolase [Pseudogracilibacillus sp. SE30717A]|uniref:2-dehydro-3-deoxy-phosphogluconate aldolase n=1 Tax=Pseudogracilibacillus sp. SE30717A TaxID=3098293 RepID=UPI00300E03B8